MSSETEDLASEFFTDLFAKSRDRQDAIDRIYFALRDHDGWLAKVTVHRYQCKRGCQIATVFRAAGLVLCAVRDYKLSPGMNAATSVEAARAEKTIDGERHWPAHVYDVEQLQRFSVGADRAGIIMNCRHFTGVVMADEILKTVDGVTAGRKTRPTRLGT